MKKTCFRGAAFLLGLTAMSQVLSGCQAMDGIPPQTMRSISQPLSRSDFLLNTFITITLYDTDDASILDDCFSLCKDYENLFSKTLETSEIYKLNHRESEEQTFTVSADTAALIEKGLYYSRLSGGAFDITIEPLSSLWNFTDGRHVIPPEEEIREAAEKVGYENVKLEGDTLTFLSPDTSLDLGGIAKGYIADRIKDYLLDAGVKSAVINLGGNVLCVGNRPDGTPFHVALQKPFAEKRETFETLAIDGLSVVVSGVYERHFIVDGKNYHHLLDPKTGWPYDNGLISTAIISENSADGDALSTACFALGLEKGMELADSLDGVYAIFITDGYEVYYSEGAEEFLLRE